MGEHVIKLPDVGEGVAEAELVEWHVKVGDLVREDALLAAVMTDKATVEIPSPVDGEVLWLGAEIGDTVAVGSPIVRLKVAGEGNAAAATAAPATAESREAGRAERSSGARRKAGCQGSRTRAEARRPPRRRRSPPVQRLQPVRRAPKARSRWRRRRCACAPARPASTCARSPARVRPAASRTRTSTPSSRAGRSPQGQAGLAPNTAVEDIKIVGLRRKIAEKMALAKSRIPHITYVEEVDVTALEDLRAALNKREARGPAEADAAAVPDAGDGQGDRRAAGDQCAVRRRGRRHPPAWRRPYRHRGADAGGPGGAGGPPRRGARPVGLRGRGRPAGRGGQGRHRDARRAVGLDHHHHLARRHGRRRHDAGHQPSRSGDRRRQQDR